MATTKRIVCLANSRKLSGRCVAGRELGDEWPGAWIRPVSDRQSQEVSEGERQYENGSDPRVLDVIDVPLLKWAPRTYQQENWVLDSGFYWSFVERMTWDDLNLLTDAVAPLWIDGSSTQQGANDQIPVARADTLTSSLILIRPDAVALAVFAPGQAFGNNKRRVQARFEHAGIEYWLWVTDPDYERKYLALPNGEHELGDCFLTISLGEPYRGYASKLVAAIIEQPTGTRRGTR